MATIVRHVLYASRSLWRRRGGGAYLWATLILSAGIGLSVAMFSLVEAVLLRPLPYPDQDDIQMIWKTDLQLHDHLVGELAFAELADLRAGMPDLESVALIPAALYGNGRVLQEKGHDAIQIETCPTTADLFRVLRVTPALGRQFEESDEAPGAAPVVALSDQVWRKHFNADPQVIGRIVRLNGTGHTVVAVMPPTLDFPKGAGLWTPLKMDLRRGATWLISVGRAKTGGLSKLQQSADRLFQSQAASFPNEYTPSQRAVVTPLAEYLTGASRSQLRIALLASLLLLIAAFVGAGNLFLSWTLTRTREVATRLSVGATRRQILGQFGVEAVVSAAIAAVLGAALAAALVRLLIHLAPPDIPRIGSAGLDPAALTFAVVAALLAAVACIVGPASTLRSGNLEAMLRNGACSAGSLRSGRLRNLFIFAQAALTVTILGVGLLLFLSYRAMLRTDLGFAHRDTLTINLALRGPGISPEARRRFYEELLDRLRGMPEVTHAAAVLLRPFEGSIGWDTEYILDFEAATRDPNRLAKANFEVITPGYFETVGTSLGAGRDFDEHDTPGSEKVAIISESLARRYRAVGRDPMMQRIQTFGAWRRVVGVTANARYRRVVQSADNVYVPYTQASPPTNYLVIRGRVGTAGLLALVRQTVKQLDAAQALAGEATLGQLIDQNTAGARFSVSLLTLFAVGAVLLSGAGIHSVMRESVAARAKEIAMRSALGAPRGRLIAETTWGALAWVIAGEIAGVVGVVVFGQAASEQLYCVTPGDPLALACVAAAMLAVAALAALPPAWKAAGQDPRAILARLR